MGITSKYEDSGCRIAEAYLESKSSHCDNCPFEDCLLGTTAGADLMRRVNRNQEIKKLRGQQGMSIQDLQGRFHLSQAMIYNILAGGEEI